MFRTWDYAILFNNVCSDEIERHKVSRKDIKYATQNLIKAYRPNPDFWKSNEPCKVDYNDVAHRCAYLQKYAPLHAAMVQDWFKRALDESTEIKTKIGQNLSNFKICSLGGGPGIDIVGVMSVLHEEFGLFSCSAEVIDSMNGWESTYHFVLDEILNGWNVCENCVSKSFTSDYFVCSFITANLLGIMDSTLNKAIGSANLITMVKFLSSATCKDTRWMVKKIFNSMRHGAFLLFIDNASGGFSDMVSRIGKECKLQTVFGPLEHQFYSKPVLNIDRRGPRSCFETRVTVHVLMKPYELTNIIETKPQILTQNAECHVKSGDYSFCKNQTRVINNSTFSGSNQNLAKNSKIDFFMETYERSDEEYSGICSLDCTSYYSSDSDDFECEISDEVIPELFVRNIDFNSTLIPPFNQDKTRGLQMEDTGASSMKFGYNGEALVNNSQENKWFMPESIDVLNQSNNIIQLTTRRKSTYTLQSFISCLQNFIPSVPVQSSNCQSQHRFFKASCGYEETAESNSPHAVLWPLIRKQSSLLHLSNSQKRVMNEGSASIGQISILPFRFLLTLLQNFIPNVPNRPDVLPFQNVILNERSAFKINHTSNYPHELQWPIIKT